jgi:hypothetical protein
VSQDEPIEEAVHWTFETYWPEPGHAHGKAHLEKKDD